MEYALYEMEAVEGFEKAIEGYKHNLNKITTGRANPAILNGVRVMYYDALTPLVEMATVSTPEARQLLIKPFDLGSVKDIVGAINSASLGLNAVNEGSQVRITLPDLTTERRREMVKSLATYTEQARVAVRLVRQDVNKAIKADEELTEDEQKQFPDLIQKQVEKFNALIEQLTKAKEDELMKI